MSREWNVYVLELDDDDAPGRRAGKPNLYVGETSKTILERLGKHLTDTTTGSAKVRRHFRCIRFDLFAGLGPFPSQEAALEAEAELAHALQQQGFMVVNRTGAPVKIPRRAVSQ